MDILIKNIEMPSCCGLCPCFHAETPMYCQADKNIRMTAPYGKKMEGCPLVELPTHGDLCDKTFLNTMIENADWSDKEALADYIIDLVYDAEVIVEASNE